MTRKQARALAPGDLIPDPDGILDLPEGFSYRILEEKGDDMDDGYRVPGRPDAMACFSGPGNTLILMRNHEVVLDDDGNGPYKGGQDPDPNAYDPQGMGGVTRLVIEGTSFERISSNLVLIGTVRNCAGGPSPWGWISCEENTDINGDHRHGYAFLCPIDAESVQPPQRLDGYGRYNHEAAAIDPSNYVAYLTEDRGDSCLYRFVPDDMDVPFTGGKLQALKVVGEDKYKVSNMGQGDVVDIEWVDIDEPDPDGDTVRSQAHAKGAAVIKRGEGTWFFEGQIYVCSTIGGSGKGQILRLIDGDMPTLEVVVEAGGMDVLDMPDNITVAPWGELFLAEDNGMDNYIRWVTAEGQVFPFARNAGSNSEFAGVCFSPKGDALFVNMQTDGTTLVITGPFPGAMDPGESDTTDEGGDTTDEGDTTGPTGEDGTSTTSGNGDGDGGDGDGGSDSGGETESGGSGGADEVGDDGGTGAPWTWPRDEVEDCNCTTTGEQSGVGALVTGLAAAALGTLIRDRE